MDSTRKFNILNDSYLVSVSEFTKIFILLGYVSLTPIPIIESDKR